MASVVQKVSSHRSLLKVRDSCKKLFSEKYLLYTNTSISLLMSCAGDGLQQKYQIGQKQIASWDKRRSRDVAVTGFLIGPFCHYWYIFLDRWWPGRSLKIVTKKLLVDQLICSPVAITSFLFFTTFFQGKRGKELKNEIWEKGKILYTAEWLVWPPVQLLNFYFLPTKYRVLFDNSVSFGFDWYFSYVKYGHELEKQEDNLDEEIPKDKVVDIGVYGSHLPFLHLQAANSVHLPHDFDNLIECFYRGHHKSHNVVRTNRNVIKEEEDESCIDER